MSIPDKPIPSNAPPVHPAVSALGGTATPLEPLSENSATGPSRPSLADNIQRPSRMSFSAFVPARPTRLLSRGSSSLPGSRAASPERPVAKETAFVGSIDCGTQSCRFYIFDQWARVVAWHQEEYSQIYPEPGWHEHDPSVYMTSIDKCIKEVLKEFETLGYEKEMLKGVGIATQRETTLVWDKNTGKPLCNAIAWPDARNAATVRALKEKAEKTMFTTPDGQLQGEEGVQAITGLPFSTYFSATKYAWLLENYPEVKTARDNGTLQMGTVDSWILYNYTGGAKNGGQHVTDYTNASRTLLLDLHTQEWSKELLDFFECPEEVLPKIVSNSEPYGEFYEGHVLEGVPIAGLVGDQQAALVGNKCLSKGEAKQTYGTGCFMLYNTGQDIIKSTHGLLTTVAYKAGPNAPVTFALEGAVAVGGSSVTWLRDNLGMVENAKEAGRFAEEVDDTGGVYFVTGFSGLFAPYWDMAATGMLIGLSTFTTKHHICRATLEATCFQTRAILEAMAKDIGEDGEPLEVLKVDGGMTGSDVTMQLQADILGIPVERPTMRESTALGAALLAGSALKLFDWDLTDPDSLDSVNEFGVKTFNPSISHEEKEWKFAGWNRAVNRSMAWKTNSGHG
ncbi:glycerol kinase [Leucosporidium creatinivorum]|uniref:glycerol kinase n=1 Tax=Leucosporidium creatinivorum TaxID=106004 RepID=A0A1Y2FZF0_9BASI|nr:glycerol kinase [Leucosporidium creatinivorum]